MQCWNDLQREGFGICEKGIQWQGEETLEGLWKTKGWTCIEEPKESWENSWEITQELSGLWEQASGNWRKKASLDQDIRN